MTLDWRNSDKLPAGAFVLESLSHCCQSLDSCCVTDVTLRHLKSCKRLSNSLDNSVCFASWQVKSVFRLKWNVFCWVMKLSPPPAASTHHIYSLSALHAQNLIWSSQHCISLRVEWWTMSLCSSSPQHHESFIQMSLWQRCHNLPLIQRTWQPGERHFRLRRILYDAPSTSRRHQLTGTQDVFTEKGLTG